MLRPPHHNVRRLTKCSARAFMRTRERILFGNSRENISSRCQFCIAPESISRGDSYPQFFISHSKTRKVTRQKVLRKTGASFRPLSATEGLFSTGDGFDSGRRNFARGTCRGNRISLRDTRADFLCSLVEKEKGENGRRNAHASTTKDREKVRRRSFDNPEKVRVLCRELKHRSFHWYSVRIRLCLMC